MKWHGLVVCLCQDRRRHNHGPFQVQAVWLSEADSFLITEFLGVGIRTASGIGYSAARNDHWAGFSTGRLCILAAYEYGIPLDGSVVVMEPPLTLTAKGQDGGTPETRSGQRLAYSVPRRNVLVVIGEDKEPIPFEHTLAFGEDPPEPFTINRNRLIGSGGQGEVLSDGGRKVRIIEWRFRLSKGLVPGQVEVGELRVAQIIEVRRIREDEVDGSIGDLGQILGSFCAYGSS